MARGRNTSWTYGLHRNWRRWQKSRTRRTGEPVLNRESLVQRGAMAAAWMLSTKVPLRDSDGRIIGIVGVNRDITEHKHDQEQLRQTNGALAERQKELLAAVADLRRSNE